MYATGVSSTENSALSALPSRRRSREQTRAVILLLPLAVFMLLVFALPIGLFLLRALDNSEIPAALPRTIAVIGDWNGEGLPPEKVFAALAEDLASGDRQLIATLGRRLNYQQPGYRGLIGSTARALRQDAPGPEIREQLVAIDPAWGTQEPWRIIKQEAGPLTSLYLLSALDLRFDQGLKLVAQESRIYVDIIVRTFVIAGLVTLSCLLIGFPFARLLAALPNGTANLLMLFVLMPFWTSVVIRSMAWILLLQSQGPVNGLLQWLEIVDQPLELVFNRFGVVIAMTHVLIPFMIFPLYATMKSIPETYVRAASALGAGPLRAFVDVYLPLASPGVIAGCLLVFITALGYYVTPALVGGAGDQMLSFFIAFNVSRTVNWGLASALAILLLLAIVVLYLVYLLLTNRGERELI